MIPSGKYAMEVDECAAENAALLRGLDGTRLLVTGAAGLIGSYLCDVLLSARRILGLDIHVDACDRNGKLLTDRFGALSGDALALHSIDVVKGPLPDVRGAFVVHAASNTSPVDYAVKPVDTMLANVIGTKNLCEHAISCGARRMLFCSSVEAYGRNNGDTDAFREDYSGYVDPNTLRADYPSSKRCAETLLNAYAAENQGFEFVIARIGRIYGPTVIEGDAKAPSQFIANAVKGEDVVLKSDGKQLYSWGYVQDCVTGLLAMLLKGQRGEAYNVADPGSCRTLGDFARAAAAAGGGNVVFSERSSVEAAGYSKITKATMDMTKLESIGWRAKRHLEDGITRTVEIMREARR